jgi:hypothetical protein
MVDRHRLTVTLVDLLRFARYRLPGSEALPGVRLMGHRPITPTISYLGHRLPYHVSHMANPVVASTVIVPQMTNESRGCLRTQPLTRSSIDIRNLRT